MQEPETAIIALEGIRLYGRHGYYPEEEILGTEFIIDVYVEANIKEAAKSDELIHTVNYETIYLICQREMKNTSSLIEKIAQSIADEIHDFFPQVWGVKVRLRKMHPPLGGTVHSAFVEIETGSFGWPKLKTLKKLRELLKGWTDLVKKFDQL